MSSRDPADLRSELEDIDFSGRVEQLSTFRAEARETVSSQQNTLDDIDTKASKILRLNVALVGILVSVLSLGTQFGEGTTGPGHLDPFVNTYTEVGIAALVLSTAFAAMTYTASELDVGVSSENLEELLRADFSTKESEELLVKNYVMRINFNRSTNVRNIPLVQLTIISLVGAIVSFVLGVYMGLVGPVPAWLDVVAAGLVIGVIGSSGLIAQMKRAILDVYEWQ